MSVKQFIRKNFQSSEYKKNIPNHVLRLRKWQWCWGDTNKDNLLTMSDLEPFSEDKWEIIDSEGDGHCFYNTLHRFLLENKLYDTQHQRTYERGQKEGILDREEMRENILTNDKEGEKKLEPPILYLRKKILKSILKKKNYEFYKKGEGEELSSNGKDIKKKYLPIMKNKGFFIKKTRKNEPRDIITGFNDAIKAANLSGKKSEGTEGWVNFGQVAVVALVLEINIIIWSVPGKKWVAFYAKTSPYDEDEINNSDILREKPVCFMYFTGNHYQNLVPKETLVPKEIDKQRKLTTKEKKDKAKEALKKLEQKEIDSNGKFKRIPATKTDEEKIKWIWERLKYRNWDVDKFVDDYGQINDNEWVCETCKNINDQGYKKCPTCGTEKERGEEKNGEEKNNGDGEEKYNSDIINLTEAEKLSLAIERSLSNEGGYKKNEEDDGWKDAITEFTTKEKNTDGTQIERNVNWNKKLKEVLKDLLTKEVVGNGYCMLNAINALTDNKLNINALTDYKNSDKYKNSRKYLAHLSENGLKRRLNKWAIKLDEERVKKNEGDIIYDIFQNDLKKGVSNLGNFWLPQIARKLNIRIIVFARAHNTDYYSYRVEEYPDKDTDEIWEYNKTYLLLNTAHYWPLKSSSDKLDDEVLTVMKKKWLKQ